MLRESEILADHFFHPRNIGDASEPSFTGRAASLVCGATARFSIQIDEQHTVSQAKFRAAGCAVMLASLSFLTEQLKGKTTVEAATIAQEPHELIKQLGAVAPDREHCAILACEAVLRAIREYSNALRSDWLGDEALICTCFCVSEQTIESEIKQHALTSIREVTKACNAGGGCGSCHHLIQDILDTVE